MNDLTRNKETIHEFIQVVWRERDLARIGEFWTADCVNHAHPGSENIGLESLRAYHQGFFEAFAAFTSVQIELLQQVAEEDRVVTYLMTRGVHDGGNFYGIPPTGKTVLLASIRIDRLENGKIAEHWSVADVAGLMQQLQ